jgi:hypothetical protein
VNEGDLAQRASFSDRFGEIRKILLVGVRTKTI